jgi:hypothetical protein
VALVRPQVTVTQLVAEAEQVEQAETLQTELVVGMGAQDVRTLFLATLHFTQVAVEELLGMGNENLMAVLVVADLGLTTLTQQEQLQELMD